MSYNRTIEMPEGDTYTAHIGHWLPRLLRTDGTTWGEDCYFRARFDDRGVLYSPSAGHLGHEGVHVQQYRAMRAAMPKWLRWTAKLWWPVHWMLNQTRLEWEAQRYATMHSADPKLVAQFLKIQSAVHPG